MILCNGYGLNHLQCLIALAPPSLPPVPMAERQLLRPAIALRRKTQSTRPQFIFLFPKSITAVAKWGSLFLQSKERSIVATQVFSFFFCLLSIQPTMRSGGFYFIECATAGYSWFCRTLQNASKHRTQVGLPCHPFEWPAPLLPSLTVSLLVELLIFYPWAVY